MYKNLEFLTIQELADLASYRSRNLGISMSEAITSVIIENPYAKTKRKEIGKELESRRERIQNEKKAETVVFVGGRKIIIQQQCDDVLKELRSTIRKPDDI